MHAYIFCIYACMSKWYACIHICTFVSLNSYMHTCACAQERCENTSCFVFLYTYAHIYTHLTRIHTHIYVYERVCVCVSLYVSAHVYL